MSAKNLLLNGLMQSDLDANHFRILNLDTSNLPPSGIPPTIIPPAHNWLQSWDSASQTWGYAQPDFMDLSGHLTATQQQEIVQVGTILAGVWRGTPLLPNVVPTLDQIRSPVANVSVGGNRITDLSDPVNDSDAVTKHFMDLLLLGLNPHAPVRCASTQDMTPATLLRPVDGITLVAGDRVLLKDQTNPAQNGVWVAATGIWTRATDSDSEAELLRAYYMVLEGTMNASTAWFQSTPAPITVDVTALTFVLFSAAQTLSAGNGLELAGNQLNVLGTAGKIAVGATVDIDATYAGQVSINTLGVVTTGMWHGSVLESEYGGTGLNNSGFVVGLGCDLNVNVLGGAINPDLVLQVTGTSIVTMPLVGTLATLAGVETLTNKRITKRPIKTSSAAQPAIDTDNVDAFYITALATNITSMSANLTGTPTDSQELIIWIKDNGVSRNIIWGPSYTASTDLPLPLLTTPTKWLFLKFMFSNELLKWVLTNKLDNI